MVSELKGSWTASTGMPCANMLHSYITMKAIRSAPVHDVGQGDTWSAAFAFKVAYKGLYESAILRP